MTTDSPDLAPATTTSDLLVAATSPCTADRTERVVPVSGVARSLAAIVPGPLATAPSTPRRDRDVADALERLRDALLETGRSLDRVAATVPGADVRTVGVRAGRS